MAAKIAARIPFILGILLMAALVIYVNLPEEKQQRQYTATATSVVAYTVEKRPFRDVIEALGTTRANEQVTIFPRYAGVVSRVNFEDGNIVTKGKILASLRSEQEKAEVDELVANLAEAKSQLQRLNNLRKTKSTSISLIEEQEAEVKAISAQLAKARARLAEMDIVAPFDGVLGLRMVSVGAYVSPSDRLTTLDDVSVIKVDFTVPERDLTTVSIGQTIEAKNIAFGDRLFAGKITSVNSRLDSVTRAVQVRAEIANSDMQLRPGMLLNIELERSVEDLIMIPESAIIPIEDRQFVYIVEDGVAVRKDIKVGRRIPGFAEIKSGIVEGEQVVVEGTIKLRPGAKVSIKEG